MADIRSLLRSELASRKGAPQAGNTGRATKKRKVDNMEDLTRKRVRSTDAKQDQQQPNIQNIQPPSAQAIAEGEGGIEQAEEETVGPELPPETVAEEQAPDTNHPLVPPDTSKSQLDTSQTIDEDEWAAFERDVAAPTRVPQAPAAVAAEATIAAAPISADELVAQQEREKELAARTRETEIEGEREDAARFMEEEFEEMEHLEERVRRLKEKREQLRKRTASGENEPKGELEPGSTESAGTYSDDDDDDDDIYDDWDSWRFR